MKKTLDKNKPNEQIKISDGTGEGSNEKYILFASVFILSGIYFFLAGNYVFFYQENHMLFVFSCDYLSQFISKPGGLLEYAGNFLTQGYFNNLYGAIIQAAVLTAIAVVFVKINDRLSPGKSFSLLFAALATCILILMQTNINYQIHNSLGFLLTGIYFLISVSCEKKVSRILIPAFSPLFFYITGAYACIYLGMITVYAIFSKKLILTVALWVIAGVSLLLSKSVIFLQPWSGLLYYPLPVTDYFVHPAIVWLLLIFFAIYPVLVILAGSIKKEFSRHVSAVSALVPVILTIILISKIYSRETVQMFNLEKMFFARDWNDVIKYQETCQLRNLVAEYYYNTALAEKRMLCDRMFFAPQDFGTTSVMIPWNPQISMSRIFRGVYFYYSIGLINEVHRWAFESMVTEGYHPENIKFLIKTNLINGHYKIAEKYVSVLKKTLHYKNLAKKYEAMIKNPDLIRSDPELGEKIKLKPKDDFLIRIRNPETNINSLLQSNPGNAKALEYKFACSMLEKDIEGIVNNISSLTKAGYSKIPRHIEEAALFYQAARGPLPDLIVLRIGSEGISRFSEYIRSTKNITMDKIKAGQGIKQELRNTYWYYLDTH